MRPACAQFKPFNWQTLPEWQPGEAGGASPFAAAALQDPKSVGAEDSVMLVSLRARSRWRRSCLAD